LGHPGTSTSSVAFFSSFSLSCAISSTEVIPLPTAMPPMFVGQEPVVQTDALLRGVGDGSVRRGLCGRGRLCEAAETIEYYVRV
jgi:hypothetical protein